MEGIYDIGRNSIQISLFFFFFFLHMSPGYVCPAPFPPQHPPTPSLCGDIVYDLWGSSKRGVSNSEGLAPVLGSWLPA